MTPLIFAEANISGVEAPVAIGVLLVLAWLAEWYYSHTKHQRDVAAAKIQAQAQTDEAVKAAIKEERRRAESFEPRHDPELHEQFVPRPEYERDRSEIRTELARHSSSRKAIYDKLEEQGRKLDANATKTDLAYAQINNLDAKMDRVLERLPRKS